MAGMLGISKRLNLFPRRLRPSFCHILNSDSDEIKSNPPSLGSSFNIVFPLGSHSVTGGPFTLPQGKHYLSFAQPVGFGFMFCRYMSSKPENWSDKFDNICSAADGVVPEKIVEAAVDQVPEVAVVAADLPSSCVALQNFIDGVHSFTGLNWWASIVLTVLLLQVSAVPIYIKEAALCHQYKQMRELAQELSSKIIAMANSAISTQEYLEALDIADLVKGRERLEALDKEFRATVIPLVIFVPVFLFTYLCSVVAIMDMAKKIPSFQNGGTLWFTDLSAPDSFCILPVLTILTMWLTIENLEDYGMVKNIVRVTMVLLVPGVAMSETVMFCQLLPYVLFAFSSELAMRHPKVKKLLKLPEMRPSFSLFEDKTPEKPQACSEPSESNKEDKKN